MTHLRVSKRQQCINDELILRHTHNRKIASKNSRTVPVSVSVSVPDRPFSIANATTKLRY
jgi:hypothetical protein